MHAVDTLRHNHTHIIMTCSPLWDQMWRIYLHLNGLVRLMVLMTIILMSIIWSHCIVSNAFRNITNQPHSMYRWVYQFQINKHAIFCIIGHSQIPRALDKVLHGHSGGTRAPCLQMVQSRFQPNRNVRTMLEMIELHIDHGAINALHT